MENNSALPNFSTSLPGTLIEVIYNFTTTRDNISLDGLEMTKVKSGCAHMMLKTEMEVDQDYTVFNYGPQRPQKDLKSQDRTTLAGL